MAKKDKKKKKNKDIKNTFNAKKMRNKGVKQAFSGWNLIQYANAVNITLLFPPVGIPLFALLGLKDTLLITTDVMDRTKVEWTNNMGQTLYGARYSKKQMEALQKEILRIKEAKEDTYVDLERADADMIISALLQEADKLFEKVEIKDGNGHDKIVFQLEPPKPPRKMAKPLGV